MAPKKRDDKKTNLLCNLCGKTLARNDSLTRHLWNEHKLGKSRMSCEESTIFFINLACIPHILNKITKWVKNWEFGIDFFVL